MKTYSSCMLKSKLILRAHSRTHPARVHEFDDYLTLVLQLVLRFRGTGFYHVRFNSHTAAWFQQQLRTPTEGASTTDASTHLRCFKFHPSHVVHLHFPTAWTIPLQNKTQAKLFLSLASSPQLHHQKLFQKPQALLPPYPNAWTKR